MITTFAKLRAPVLGRGKATIIFSKSFNKLEPEDQITTLDQAMKQLSDRRKLAAQHKRIKLANEDAVNAEMIRAHA